MPSLRRTLNRLVILTGFGICLNYSKSPALALISFSFLCVPACFILALTGQLIRSLTISSTLVITTHLLARLKILYYKDALVASDIHVILDPDNWETLIHYPGAAIALTLLLALQVISIMSHRSEKRYPLIPRVVALLIGIIFIFAADLSRNNSRAYESWMARLPKGQGTFANLIFSTRSFDYSPPKFTGNDALFLEKAASIKSTEPVRSEKSPDIVVLLQESTVNPAIFHLPGAQLPTLKMFEPNPYTDTQSWLRVHTFGGATWLSEFALFSGLSSRDFGAMATSVYYTVTPHLKTSLVKVLKANGYNTVVLTPSNKSHYHASFAYNDFGFDEIIQPQDLGYPAHRTQNLWKIESAELLQYAKKVLESRTSKPLFLFGLTMKEHGPYEEDHPLRYGLEHAGLDINMAGKLSDYIGRLIRLSEATEAFSAFLMQRNRPTIFVYFGDHQSLSFNPPGRYSTKLEKNEYVTQFVLRKNFEAGPKERFALFDLAFMGGLILEKAGLKPDPFFSANIQMRKLCQGRLQDCPDPSLVESYRHFIYQTLAVAG